MLPSRSDRFWRLISRRPNVMVGVVALLMLALALQVWRSYDQVFGTDRGRDLGVAKMNDAGFHVSREMTELARLQADALRLASGSIARAQFDAAVQEAADNLNGFRPGSPLAEDFAAFASFAAAYQRTQALLESARGLRPTKASTAALDAEASRAIEMWADVSRAVFQRERERRQQLGQDLVRVRNQVVLIIVLFVALGIFVVAAVRLTVSSERQRIARFELLMATVGHDLRSPLQALVGAARLAATETQAPLRERFVRIVDERSGYFLRLLDDMIAIASAQTLQHKLAPFDLHEWASLAFERYRQACAGKSLEFRSSIDAPQGWVVFDRDRLTQVVDNLVTNAVRYTLTGFVEVRIECVGSAGSATLRAVVQDSGRGIAPEDHQRIFEPFVRLHAHKNDGPGLGLGLALAASVARHAGGRTWVDSSVAEGARFVFEVPVSLGTPAPSVERAPAPVAQAPTTTADASRVPSTADLVQAQSAPRILVVDDDAAIGEVLRQMLVSMGYDADFEPESTKALAVLITRSYQAVLTDVNMSGLTGVELAALIRQRNGADMRIVAMTAFSDPEASDRRLFDYVLRKPINAEDLLRVFDDID